MTKIRRLGHSDHQFLVWRKKVRQSACTWGTRSIPINVHEREIPEVRRPSWNRTNKNRNQLDHGAIFLSFAATHRPAFTEQSFPIKAAAVQSDPRNIFFKRRCRKYYNVFVEERLLKPLGDMLRIEALPLTKRKPTFLDPHEKGSRNRETECLLIASTSSSATASFPMSEAALLSSLSR